MIYGNDFSGADDGTVVNNPVLKGWSIDKIADARINNTKHAPGFKNLAAKDGNNLFIYTWTQGAGKFAYTTTDNIARAKFDVGYDSVDNNGSSNRGNATVNVLLGDTAIATYDWSAKTLTVGSTVAKTDSVNTDVTNKWLSYDVAISGTTATVTVKDGETTIIDAVAVTLSSDAVKLINFNTNSTWGGVSVDNLELYKAAE